MSPEKLNSESPGQKLMIRLAFVLGGILLGIVTLALLNAFLFMFFAAMDRLYPEPGSGRGFDPLQAYGAARVLRAYPDLELREVEQLIEETWSRRLAKDALIGHREGPYEGRYVNVDPNGFRRSLDQGPWPPDAEAFNVFMFGGSTTFGYGVPDDQTIPSYLQQRLSQETHSPVYVYNLGHGDYKLRHEYALFSRMLGQGLVPDLAVFMDGVNEFVKPPQPHLSRLHAIMNRHRRSRLPPSGWIHSLPMARLARSVMNSLDEMSLTTFDETTFDVPEMTRAVLEEYLAIKKKIEGVALRHDVPVAFVWQPVASYDYDVEQHPFWQSESSEYVLELGFAAYGYREVERLARSNEIGDNFFWCADAAAGVEGVHYVDLMHYSAIMHEHMANLIGDFLLGRDYLVGAAPSR
ncbi:MAG: SGNH/GDSL hydrolase family protein [Deltaproteobacteria bacterium]|nr:SGNH/GDSL hydrolase family protein [Deltaproteobacteria bacterium]